MGLNLEQKQAVVSEVSAQLAKAQAVIVAEYRGLDVARVTQLRAKARKSGLYLRVLKNTLARRAVKGTPFEKLSEQMFGPLMYGISQDPVAGAKVMSEFAKENELFVIKAGAMPNSMMSAQDIKAAIFRDDDGLRLRQLGRYFCDYGLLLLQIKTQGLPPYLLRRTWNQERRLRREQLD